MIESAAIAIVTAVFFGAVVLPVLPRLALVVPLGVAPPPVRPSPPARVRAGNSAPMRPSTRGIRISSAAPQFEAKVRTKLARRVAMLIERYPERSLMVIRRWLHEAPA
ncbi:MAG: hypothetical protein HOA18_14475 [Rhodospirillaceae bacterium]|nr:hypothetical protein [Rhodospirillaceae bacterium]